MNTDLQAQFVLVERILTVVEVIDIIVEVELLRILLIRRRRFHVVLIIATVIGPIKIELGCKITV